MSNEVTRPAVTGHGAGSLPQISGSGYARTRQNAAVQHMLAAARFARMTGDVEAAHTGEPFGEFFEDLMHYATASILFSAASLEAYINELFVDADTTFPEHRLRVTNEVWALAWERIERQTVLAKYAQALQLKKRPIFWERAQKGSDAVRIYNAVATLIEVRDAFLHFKPQWHDERKSHSNLTARLKKQPIGTSPFFGPNEVFPRICMSHGCACWSVTSSLDFVAAFSQEAGLVNKFDGVMARLSPR